MFAKAGLVVIGLCAISIGGVAVAKPHLLGMDYMPEFHALSKDHDFSSNNNYQEGKFGKKYKNYLVGVTNKTSEDDNTSNRAWWEWAFRKLQRDDVSSGKFQVKGEGKKVDQPYSKNKDDKALNQVCKKFYKEEDPNSNESDVWKYCSSLGKKPTKVKDNNEEKNKYSGAIGSEENSDFISIDDTNNDMFWLIRDKEIKGSDKDNFEQVTVTTSANSDHFKDTKTSLKELCRKAYITKTPSNAEGTPKPTKEDTQKYCKFEIS